MRVNLEHPVHYRPAIGWLVLSGLKLNDEDMAEVKAFLSQHPEITKVDLSCNDIGDAGAQELAGIPNLMLLNLHNNKIGDKGAIALAANPSLKLLLLSANPIGNEGRNALMYCPTIMQVQLNNEEKAEPASYFRMTNLPAALRMEAATLENIDKYREETFTPEFYEDEFIQALGWQILKAINIVNDNLATPLPNAVLYMTGYAYFNFLRNYQFEFPAELIHFLSEKKCLDDEVQSRNHVSQNYYNIHYPGELSAIAFQAQMTKFHIEERLKIEMNKPDQSFIRLALSKSYPDEFANLDHIHTENALRSKLKPLEARTQVATLERSRSRSDALRSLAEQLQTILERTLVGKSGKADVETLRDLSAQIEYITYGQLYVYAEAIDNLITIITLNSEKIENEDKLTAFKGFDTHTQGMLGLFARHDEKQAEKKAEVKNNYDSETVEVNESKIVRLLKVLDARKPSYPTFKMVIGLSEMSNKELDEVKRRTKHPEIYHEFCLRLEAELQEESAQVAFRRSM